MKKITFAIISVFFVIALTWCFWQEIEEKDKNWIWNTQKTDSSGTIIDNATVKNNLTWSTDWSWELLIDDGYEEQKRIEEEARKKEEELKKEELSKILKKEIKLSEDELEEINYISDFYNGNVDNYIIYSSAKSKSTESCDSISSEKWKELCKNMIKDWKLDVVFLKSKLENEDWWNDFITNIENIYNWKQDCNNLSDAFKYLECKKFANKDFDAKSAYTKFQQILLAWNLTMTNEDTDYFIKWINLDNDIASVIQYNISELQEVVEE